SRVGSRDRLRDQQAANEANPPHEGREQHEESSGCGSANALFRTASLLSFIRWQEPPPAESGRPLSLGGGQRRSRCPPGTQRLANLFLEQLLQVEGGLDRGSEGAVGF